jgi:TonB family protein
LTVRPTHPTVGVAATALTYRPMFRVWLLAASAAHLTFLATLGAQGDDSTYAGHHCDKGLTELRLPSLLGLGDSARLDAALNRSADPQAHIAISTSNLLRVNSTGQVRLLALTATCPALGRATPEYKALLRQIQRDTQGPRVYRRVLVRFILEPDSHVSDAWIDVSTGVPGLDSLAMQLFHTMRYDPAIVGRTTVATLLTQPFEF